MNLKRLAPLTLAVAVWGCSKKPGPASAEYSKAQGQFLTLLNQKPLDVYGDPSLSGILSSLDSVPADSISHEAAVALATQIRTGQADYAKASSDRAAAVANANKSTPPTGTLSVVQAQPAQPSSDTPAPAAVDAGPGGPTGGPTVGMSADEFNSRFGLCFSRTSTYTITANGKDSRGDIYSLNEQAACLARYSSFSGQLIMVSGGKVQRFASKADVVSQETVTVNQPVQVPVQNPNQTPGPNLAGNPPLPGLPTPAQPTQTQPTQAQPTQAQPQPPRPPQNVLPDATPPPPPANTPPQDPNYNPNAVNR